MEDASTITYAPPPGPPPPSSYAKGASAATQSDLNYLLPPAAPPFRLDLLASCGWQSLSFSSTEFSELQDAYAEVFRLASEYFSLPDTDPQKTEFGPSGGEAKSSDDGFSRIPGEKQIVTIRHARHLPPGPLRDSVQRAWGLTVPLLLELLRDMAASLDLSEGVFDGIVEPSLTIPGGDGNVSAEISPCLFRMFRYERPVLDETTSAPKLVSEPHKDLGLLSLVVGHTPGLEVFEPANHYFPTGRWIDVEERRKGETLTATLLVGQMLTWLTNGRLRGGVHRVLMKPTGTGESPFRLSLVFALRPIAKVTMQTKDFEGPFTGKFAEEVRFDGKAAGSMISEISSKLYNVNVKPEQREAQKKRLAEIKAKASTNC